MAKSSSCRKTKEKKQQSQKTQIKDFKKRKVKVGKKIPKAENATTTNFKSKSIVIREQLKAAGGHGSSGNDARSRNMKELFVKLRHYNSSMRQDAVIGLKEIVTRFPGEIIPNLSPLIDSVSAVFTDTTDSVRMSAISLTKLILSATSPDRVAPFFPTINAHMCSAMTHIHEDIQIDSLKILDVILDNYPGLVMRYRQQIIPNFLNLIAKKHGQAKLGSAMTLSVNPDSKLTGQRWQHLVLRRLENFLQIILTPANISTTTSATNNKLNVIVNVSSGQVTRVDLPKHTPSPFLFANAYKMKCDDVQPTSNSVNKIEMKELISSILPVLFECWLETSPSRLLTQALPGNELGTDQLYGLQKILSVIRLVCDHIDTSSTDDLSMSWFRKTYLKSLEKHVFPLFPFEMKKGRKSNQPSLKESQLSALSMNLLICEIISTLSTNKYIRTSWYRKSETFICEILSGNSNFSNDNFKLLLRVVEKFLKVSKQKEVILQHVYQCYNKTHILSQNRFFIINLFSKIILSKNKDSNYGLTSCSGISAWMESLPLLLRQVAGRNSDVTHTVLAVMLDAISSNNRDIAEVFINNIYQLFDVDFFTKISEEQQRKLFELVYHVSKPRHDDTNSVEYFNIFTDMSLIKQFIICSLHPTTNATVVTYLLHILYDIYTSSQCEGSNNVDSLCNYLSMIVTFLIGFQNDELKRKRDEILSTSDERDRELISILGSSVYKVPNEIWLKHQHITLVIQKILVQFHSFESCWLTILHAMSSVLIDIGHLPITTIYSVCSTIVAVHPGDMIVPVELIRPLSVSCLASLVITSSANSSESTSIITNIEYTQDIIDIILQLMSRIPTVTCDILETLTLKINECHSSNSFSRLISVSLQFLQSPCLSDQLRSNKLIPALMSTIKAGDNYPENSDIVKSLNQIYHICDQYIEIN